VIGEREVIGMDCVGTVFSTRDVPRADMEGYIAQVRRPQWEPLKLAPSFAAMIAHPDAAEGVRRLRAKYRVVTCSNLPAPLLRILSYAAGIQWDAIVPLEASRSYKPNDLAYQTVCDVTQAFRQNVTIVTAHPDGPDATGAPAAGMKLQIIRQPGCPQTIIELAEMLGC